MAALRSLPLLAAMMVLSACAAATATDDAANAVTEAEAPTASVATLTAGEVSAMLDEGNIRLIDVRRDDEVAAGMIPGAEHIVLDDFDPSSLDLSDGREVVLYCRSGRRSGIAAEKLAAHTGATARHLEGGIIAWEEAQLPIAR